MYEVTLYTARPGGIYIRIYFSDSYSNILLNILLSFLLVRHVEEERGKKEKKKKSLLIEPGDPGQAAGVGQLSCGPRWAPDCGVCGSSSMCLK